jgi:hypothetical protein
MTRARIEGLPKPFIYCTIPCNPNQNGRPMRFARFYFYFHFSYSSPTAVEKRQAHE